MSIADPAPPQAPGTPGSTVAPRRPGRGTRRLSGLQVLVIALAGFALLSFVRAVTGAEPLTAGGTVGATIALALPIGMAGLGGLWSERSGVVNIGLEGMMILGTFFGADFAYFSHSPWVGVLGGLVGGFIGGAVHAVATVTFGVDQIVSGVAITILATGLARYLAGVFFTGQRGGGPTQSPGIPQFSSLKVPGADSALSKVERHHWFLVSDLAGVLRGLATTLTPFTILLILLFPLSWFLLWRTAFGLRLRSCGENPAAAESLGVPVYRMKYIAVIVSGMLAGLAGAFLADFAGIYREGQTGGRGFIGLAAMIFGNWRPGGLAAGAGLFGYTDAVQSRGQATAVHALLLLVALLLLAIAGMMAWRRRLVPAIGAVAGAGLVFLWFGVTDDVPVELVPYTPYIITLLVLALASQRLRMPAADGIPWRKGQGT
ncbi:MAG TPA: ABC transporter permease [Jatrophihabitantaceae bacterium]|nr:ABC transporter permease [Jatrophihabitantaceae bacterium]